MRFLSSFITFKKQYTFDEISALLGEKIEVDSLLKENRIFLLDKTYIHREEIEKKLGMEHLSGPEKGQKIRKLRNQFIQEFGKDSVIPASTLKGKDLKRVFWAVVNIDNLNKIEGMI